MKEKVITRQEVVEEESAIIDVVDKVSPSVVSIIVKTVTFDLFSGPTASEEGIGTGFIVSPNGLIVTNSHVVDSVDGQYSVVLKDGTSYDVESINLDEQSDLAILQIAGRNLPAVQLGDSDILKVGQKAIAIGNALGRFQNTVTTGVVSGVGRQLTASSGFGFSGDTKVYESVIQTDAAINPGNSGGPLLNSSGQVIGINVATTRGADNISFAIPVNTLKPVLEGFLRDGRIIKPYLGISYTLITDDIAKARNMPQGAFVSAVFPDTPAKKAGLERGDVIVKIDGKEINSENSVAKVVSERKVGDTIQLEIDRSVLTNKSEKLTLQVVLEESPNTTR
ncbi:hypothetical protein A3F07_03505 [candidate division WWE3 bacterium RIFCSPHIGHO2_12_FULL_38_15]|uniref:PDZ domain-containing protein n=1 Tax=candidate division WWE3 bacterium RIFCSPHIGHO2_02_FULL_38_14 TaxID=1802620 RepID=A0A1F4V7A0_UNCKA|nr:MAG: hypothetical protein A2793_02875 [candidate division WWE3 bacterium RIFCSPHIGHO2_01_FULL_38_45]OGC48888.1 MAG: hypothetical protein A3F07_03505 [candidate division WWE3 bacterium RIFCSPHIGHO2_12_FULL_38_15]OGC53041.1 MAG: hypothetical protein A3D91_01735 [candidate division WWE3 bacterium RIFCSPHIGHO2_02_FULL_38_14]OGC53193.1 MAG: hypothetical protein A3B64_01845 [candidate division WWE3 bacterium RIFCSPLOWO2_01_FULL_37_24]